MKFYLSSFKFGKEKQRLISLASTKQIAIIPNALDFRGAKNEQTKRSLENKTSRLAELGFDPEVVDLKNYFGEYEELKRIIDKKGSVFILGGNVFVLRQAMKLSGLDDIIASHKDDPTFLYAGYSAAGCVLAPSLEIYKGAANFKQTPYPEQSAVITEGLGLVDFYFMPHWDSDHHESERIGKLIEYCIEHDLKYKPVRDGDVLIF